MLKHLRKDHPLGYCIGAEVIFLASLILTSYLVVFLLVLFDFNFQYADDYLLGCVQEAVGLGWAVFLLKKTGKTKLLRQRGCGFFSGMLVGMYPLALIVYSLYTKMLFGRPDGPMLPAWRIVSFLVNMTLVGVAEEVLFRGVIGQTLLEHFGTSRAGIWKACLLSGLAVWRGASGEHSVQRPAGRADAMPVCGVAGCAVCGYLLPDRKPLGHNIFTCDHGYHFHADRRSVRD